MKIQVPMEPRETTHVHSCVPGAKSLLSVLEDNACDLRCVNVLVGDDYEIDWIVVAHHHSKPKEREIGRGRTPESAILQAFCQQKGRQHEI